MKKILSLSALVALLVLTACGSTVETVCTFNMFGEEMIFIAESEDGVITSITTEMRIDISGLDLDSDALEAMAEDEGGVIQGDEIVVTETETDLEEDLDDFISGMELIGATCE